MSLKIDLKSIEKKLRANYKDAKKRVAVSALERLKEATPVDTGKARDSWRIEEQIDGDVKIINDANYIKDLNAGSSVQAPKFFVEQALIDTPGISPNSISVVYKE